MLLKRRHSEFLRRRFTASLKADHRSLDKVPESNLTKLSECAETPSPTGLNSPELSRHSFCRNCPARKARRSRVIRPRNVVLETTPGSSVKDKTSNHQHQGFGKASKYRKQYLQYPRALDFSEKPDNCKINVSFYGLFKKGALKAKWNLKGTPERRLVWYVFIRYLIICHCWSFSKQSATMPLC